MHSMVQGLGGAIDGVASGTFRISDQTIIHTAKLISQHLPQNTSSSTTLNLSLCPLI